MSGTNAKLEVYLERKSASDPYYVMGQKWDPNFVDLSSWKIATGSLPVFYGYSEISAIPKMYNENFIEDVLKSFFLNVRATGIGNLGRIDFSWKKKSLGYNQYVLVFSSNSAFTVDNVLYQITINGNAQASFGSSWKEEPGNEYHPLTSTLNLYWFITTDGFKEVPKMEMPKKKGRIETRTIFDKK